MTQHGGVNGGTQTTRKDDKPERNKSIPRDYQQMDIRIQSLDQGFERRLSSSSLWQCNERWRPIVSREAHWRKLRVLIESQ